MIDLGFSPEWGYAGLFLIAFLSATLLPLGSEVGVTVMALSGYHRPATWAVATAGNTLGALFNYGLGRWGRTIVDRRRPEAEGKATARAAAALRPEPPRGVSQPPGGGRQGDSAGIGSPATMGCPHPNPLLGAGHRRSAHADRRPGPHSLRRLYLLGHAGKRTALRRSNVLDYIDNYRFITYY